MDYESGAAAFAGRHGRVVAVTFSGGEHALIVAIETTAHGERVADPAQLQSALERCIASMCLPETERRNERTRLR